MVRIISIDTIASNWISTVRPRAARADGSRHDGHEDHEGHEEHFFKFAGNSGVVRLFMWRKVMAFGPGWKAFER
jgi:hypothetical protein